MDALSQRRRQLRLTRIKNRGLNVFEFVAILLVVGGLSYGFTRGLEEGVWSATIEAMKWGGIAWLWWAAAMLVIFTLLWLMLLYRPHYPRCRKGGCRDRHYQAVTTELAQSPQLGQEGRAKEGILVRCRCGDLYLRPLGEERFYEVTPEGELRPYLRCRPYRRWEPDPG